MPNKHSTYGRVKVKSIQLFLGEHILLHRYSVTVLQFKIPYSIPPKILLYLYIFIYINIELIFDPQTIVFGTVTL